MAREDVELIIKQAREVLSSSRNWVTLKLLITSIIYTNSHSFYSNNK